MFRSSKWNLYEFLESSPTFKTDPSGKQCCVHLWLPRNILEVGHAALKCSGQYYSFWPVNGVDLWSSTDACHGHTETEDETSEGRLPDSIKCLSCPVDESAIGPVWQTTLQECKSGTRQFCLYGGNCSTSVGRLLKAAVPTCTDTCYSCESQNGCKDTCGGAPTEGVPGSDQPSNVGEYLDCLESKKCNSMVANCVRNIEFGLGMF